MEVVQKVQWDPAKTAAIICDMWDKHWCKAATARVTEIAPRTNEVVKALRARRVFIIHCPSDTMEFYKDHPGRRLAQSAPPVPSVPMRHAQEPPLPIDDSDGGCDCEPQCQTAEVWHKQIDTVQIEDGDAITDSAEAICLMRQRGIENVIFMGVHENMCVLNRPFGIRQLVSQGLNVVFIRDLTDTMYNHRRPPYVDHFTGTDLVTEHIEKYLCPTITSDQIVGGKPFCFAADKRPR